MNMVIIGTGSKGNCLILTSKETGHSIMLDCGIEFRKITNHPQFPSFKNLDAVCVSHIH